MSIAAQAVQPANAPDDAPNLAVGLRAAVRSENYQQLPEMLLGYSQWVQDKLREASEPAETQQLLEEAAELLQWAKSAVAAHRAHAQMKLDQIDHAASYNRTEERSSRTWAVRG